MEHQLQQKIQSILDQCVDMTVATIRPDGTPQATVVSFVHDGLVLFFVCGASSQKAANIARQPYVALTMTAPYESWDEIEGLSISAIAETVTDAKEVSEISKLFQRRYPQVARMEPGVVEDVEFIRLRPQFISVLDYTKGFGHTDLVTVAAGDIEESLKTTRHRWLIPT